MNKTFWILCTLMQCVPIQYSFAQETGHEIKFECTNTPNQQLVLAHYFGNTMLAKDTVNLDSYGKGILRGENVLGEGVYAMFFPDGSRKEFLITSDQHFTFQISQGPNTQGKNFIGSQANISYMQFNAYINQAAKKIRVLQEKQDDTSENSERKQIKAEIEHINQARFSRVLETINENKGNFLALYLKATLDINVPHDIPLGSKQYSAYKKTHFFENFPVSDERLLRTPIYYQKVQDYLDKVVEQTPDSIIAGIDKILQQVENNNILYQFLCNQLITRYENSRTPGMDKVFVHIGQKYYTVKNWWDSPEFIAKLKEHLLKEEKLLIGKTAPDISLIALPDEKQSSLAANASKTINTGKEIHIRDIKSKYCILFFWDPKCKHCKEEIKKLHNNYQVFLKKNLIEVVAISTLNGTGAKQSWQQILDENNLHGWINAWQPNNNTHIQEYNIIGIPKTYILDTRKKIIGKNIAANKVQEFIAEVEKNQLGQ